MVTQDPEGEAVRLTKRAIDAAAYAGEGNARLVIWDDEVPGFGCRVYPGGRKAFVLSYRVAGRKRLLTVGTYGVLTLDQARTKARAELAKVETEGADPLAERERERQGETVQDLATAYMERHGDAKKSGTADRRRLNQYILPKWGATKARAITRADVAALHSRIGKAHPYEANRVLALLSKMFELARRWGFVPEGHPNPARDIDRFREAKRDRWVTPDELPRLARAIDEEPNEVARFALWLYLLTGARKSELLRAKWSDVDWTRSELRIPETKAGRVHYIPLSAPALALLREIPRVEGNPFILVGRGHRGASEAEKKANPHHLVNISKPWERVREAATLAHWRALGDSRIDALLARLEAETKRSPTVAEVRASADFDLPGGILDVRLHDLRRTVGSWLAQAGNSLHLIGRVLNHSNQATTAVYARFGEDSVRAALEQHGARILGAAGLAPTAEVATLPTRTAVK